MIMKLKCRILRFYKIKVFRDTPYGSLNIKIIFGLKKSIILNPKFLIVVSLLWPVTWIEFSES